VDASFHYIWHIRDVFSSMTLFMPLKENMGKVIVCNTFSILLSYIKWVFWIFLTISEGVYSFWRLVRVERDSLNIVILSSSTLEIIYSIEKLPKLLQSILNKFVWSIEMLQFLCSFHLYPIIHYNDVIMNILNCDSTTWGCIWERNPSPHLCLFFL